MIRSGAVMALAILCLAAPQARARLAPPAKAESAPPAAAAAGVADTAAVPPAAASAAPAAEAVVEAPAPEAQPATPAGPSNDTRSSAMLALEKALAGRRLAATAPLGQQRLREELVAIEEKLSSGRRDEAIGDLVYLIESPQRREQRQGWRR